MIAAGGPARWALRMAGNSVSRPGPSVWQIGHVHDDGLRALSHALAAHGRAHASRQCDDRAPQWTASRPWPDSNRRDWGCRPAPHHSVTGSWHPRAGSNRRQPASEAGALSAELRGHAHCEFTDVGVTGGCRARFLPVHSRALSPLSYSHHEYPRRESNPRPAGRKPAALPVELHGQDGPAAPAGGTDS